MYIMSDKNTTPGGAPAPSLRLQRRALTLLLRMAQTLCDIKAAMSSAIAADKSESWCQNLADDFHAFRHLRGMEFDESKFFCLLEKLECNLQDLVEPAEPGEDTVEGVECVVNCIQEYLQTEMDTNWYHYLHSSTADNRCPASPMKDNLPITRGTPNMSQPDRTISSRKSSDSSYIRGTQSPARKENMSIDRGIAYTSKPDPTPSGTRRIGGCSSPQRKDSLMQNNVRYDESLPKEVTSLQNFGDIKRTEEISCTPRKESLTEDNDKCSNLPQQNKANTPTCTACTDCDVRKDNKHSMLGAIDRYNGAHERWRGLKSNKCRMDCSDPMMETFGDVKNDAQNQGRGVKSEENFRNLNNSIDREYEVRNPRNDFCRDYDARNARKCVNRDNDSNIQRNSVDREYDTRSRRNSPDKVNDYRSRRSSVNRDKDIKSCRNSLDNGHCTRSARNSLYNSNDVRNAITCPKRDFDISRDLKCPDRPYNTRSARNSIDRGNDTRSARNSIDRRKDIRSAITCPERDYDITRDLKCPERGNDTRSAINSPNRGYDTRSARNSFVRSNDIRRAFDCPERGNDTRSARDYPETVYNTRSARNSFDGDNDIKNVLDCPEKGNDTRSARSSFDRGNETWNTENNAKNDDEISSIKSVFKEGDVLVVKNGCICPSSRSEPQKNEGFFPGAWCKVKEFFRTSPDVMWQSISDDWESVHSSTIDRCRKREPHQRCCKGRPPSLSQKISCKDELTSRSVQTCGEYPTCGQDGSQCSGGLKLSVCVENNGSCKDRTLVCRTGDLSHNSENCDFKGSQSNKSTDDCFRESQSNRSSRVNHKSQSNRSGYGDNVMVEPYRSAPVSRMNVYFQRSPPNSDINLSSQKPNPTSSNATPGRRQSYTSVNTTPRRRRSYTSGNTTPRRRQSYTSASMTPKNNQALRPHEPEDTRSKPVSIDDVQNRLFAVDRECGVKSRRSSAEREKCQKLRSGASSVTDGRFSNSTRVSQCGCERPRVSQREWSEESRSSTPKQTDGCESRESFSEEEGFLICEKVRPNRSSKRGSRKALRSPRRRESVDDRGSGESRRGETTSRNGDRTSRNGERTSRNGERSSRRRRSPMDSSTDGECFRLVRVPCHRESRPGRCRRFAASSESEDLSPRHRRSRQSRARRKSREIC